MRQICGKARGIDAEVLDDAVQVAILILQDLMQPMRQFDIRIASQLAEYGSALDGFVAQRVQLAEKRNTADVRHRSSPYSHHRSDVERYAIPCQFPASTRSPASVSLSRVPSQVVQPSLPV